MKKTYLFAALLLSVSTALSAAGTELFDPAKGSIESTYFAPNWVVETNSTATYDAAKGAISVDLKSTFRGQWQSQVKFKHGMTFKADKTYNVSVKFLSNKECGGVTLKIDDNTGMVLENQTINLKANEFYTYTKENVVGVAGNNQIMVFDFGWAGEGTQITISDISVIENAALEDDAEAPKDVKAVVTPSYISANIAVSATDNSGLVTYSVMNGDAVVATASGMSGAEVTIPVTGLTPATQYNYTVVASDAKGNKAEAVAATINTLALSAAPAPAREAGKVFSLYSDAYTAAATWVVGQWSQTTVGTDGLIAENEHAFVCTTATYMGWEINGNQPIDVTAYPFLSMDIYVEVAATINFTPIWGKESLKNYSLKAGWNTIDIDLAKDFAGINLANIYQLKWADMPATCVIDNVYFYKQGTTTLVETVVKHQVTNKTIENGQLIIIRDGIRYNTIGQVIE